MRLQDTYQLSPSQLADGKISSKFKSKPLTGLLKIIVYQLNSINFTIFSSLNLALECFDLGRLAYTNGDFYHTLMWMQEALVHLDKETVNRTMNKIDILDHLAYATSQVNK